MIYLREISLSFADRKIFEKINWTITDRGGSALSAATAPAIRSQQAGTSPKARAILDIPSMSVRTVIPIRHTIDHP